MLGGCGGEEGGPETSGESLSAGEYTRAGTDEQVGDTLTAKEGRVVAGRNLGFVVTGTGSTAATRSLEIMEQRVLSFLPHLQAVYEQERQKQSHLMGRVETYLTISANGSVSDLRFPKFRVSDERLLDVIFDPITTWVFPAAKETVQLRATLLFVPPSIDLAAVTAWERQVVAPTSRVKSGPGSVVPRKVAARSDSASADALEGATERSSLSARESSAENQSASPPPFKPTKKVPSPFGSGASSSSSPEKREVARSRPPAGVHPDPITAPIVRKQTGAGWYQIRRSTALRAEPRTSAALIALLQPGTKVKVVRSIAGTWLEVRSVSGRQPGYLHWADATRISGPG